MNFDEYYRVKFGGFLLFISWLTSFSLLPDDRNLKTIKPGIKSANLLFFLFKSKRRFPPNLKLYHLSKKQGNHFHSLNPHCTCFLLNIQLGQYNCRIGRRHVNVYLMLFFIKFIKNLENQLSKGNLTNYDHNLTLTVVLLLLLHRFMVFSIHL